jgi:hypothetical protein
MKNNPLKDITLEQALIGLYIDLKREENVKIFLF